MHRHGPTTQQHLARTIGVTARNITALVDTGFVRRDPHPDDRRAVLIQLIDPGRRVTGQLTADYETGSAQLFANMTPAKVGQFLAVMDTLTNRLAATLTPGA